MGVLAGLVLLLGWTAPASADPPESWLTVDQRAGAVRSPDGRWDASLLQTAVELEARWPAFGIAARLVDYQLASLWYRTLGASVGVRVPILRRGHHRLVAAFDAGGARYVPLLFGLGDDGGEPRGLALTGEVRWVSPVSPRTSLGANLRFGGMPRTGVRWASLGLVLSVHAGG